MNAVVTGGIHKIFSLLTCKEQKYMRSVIIVQNRYYLTEISTLVSM
jgi:hypothetical protein